MAIGIFVLATYAPPAIAAPACPMPTAFTQPNGSVIQIYLKGDEFLSWTEDAIGNLIAYDPDPKAYCYADWTDEGPASTKELVAPSPNPEMGHGRTKGSDIPQSLRDKVSQMREEQANWLEEIREGMLENLHLLGFDTQLSQSSTSLPPLRAPAAALKRNLLIIHATWSNRTGINTAKLDGNQIHNLVFNPAANSVNKYYKELFGIADDVIIPATVVNPLNGYQGIIEVTLPGQHTNPGGNDDACIFIMRTAIAKASQNGHINFANYDANKNGIVEATELCVGVIVDGYETSRGLSPGFWASAWSEYAPNKSSTNNVRLQGAFGQGAFHGNSGIINNDMLTIGVVCHELGHSGFGFADMYDTTNSSRGHGYWSLMSYGSRAANGGERPGESPSYADAYNLTRSSIVSPGIVTSRSTATITLSSHLDIYRVSSMLDIAPRTTQYFLLQQRKYGMTVNYDRGAFHTINASSNTGTGGLLIYHVDTQVPTSVMNTKSSHYRVAIAEAHGGVQNLRQASMGANNGDLNDLWGSSYHLFSDTTDPSTRMYSPYTNNSVAPTKNILPGIEFSNITWNSSASSTSIDVQIEHPPIPPVLPPPPIGPFKPTI